MYKLQVLGIFDNPWRSMFGFESFLRKKYIIRIACNMFKFEEIVNKMKYKLKTKHTFQ